MTNADPLVFAHGQKCAAVPCLPRGLAGRAGAGVRLRRVLGGRANRSLEVSRHSSAPTMPNATLGANAFIALKDGQSILDDGTPANHEAQILVGIFAQAKVVPTGNEGAKIAFGQLQGVVHNVCGIRHGLAQPLFAPALSKGWRVSVALFAPQLPVEIVDHRIDIISADNRFDGFKDRRPFVDLGKDHQASGFGLGHWSSPSLYVHLIQRTFHHVKWKSARDAIIFAAPQEQ